MDDAIDQMHKTAKAIILSTSGPFRHDQAGRRDHRPRTRSEAVLEQLTASNAARLNAIAEEVTRLEDGPTASMTPAYRR
jgi:hypothetical protein